MVATFDRRVTTAAPEQETSEDVGELEVAEWIVLLLAYDTYYRTLKERTAIQDPSDAISAKGHGLLRTLNSTRGDEFHGFLLDHMPNDNMRKMLAKAFRLGTTRQGLPKQALQIRTILSRGGAGTIRKVFKTNRAINEVRAAMSSACLDDGPQALDKFAVITLQNSRIKTWVASAARSAGSGTFQDAVSAAVTATQDEGHELVITHARSVAAPPLSEASHQANTDRTSQTAIVQAVATEAASKALEVSGKPDVPPTRSEVIGIATAATVAVKAQSVPESLVGLDAEQVDAALTDGRVLVIAGAGSGKTTTVTARTAYLVREKKVSPSRIFVVSFNRKASRELKERIGARVGDDTLNQMNVGTMHGMFRKFVVENGTTEEKAALTTWLMTPPTRKSGEEQRPGRAPNPSAFAGYMARIWKECKNSEPPKKAKTVIQAWVMNNITPEQAKAKAHTAEQLQLAEWYEWTDGFKGVNKSWKPPCVNSNFKAGKQWGEFLAKWRDGGKARLGDFSDMILLFRDLMKRDPMVRRKVQGMFDHILVDEAQDLNAVQHEIIDMMAEQIDEAKGQSEWLVGDEVQSVNRFVGARPELLTQFHGKPGWKTKTIKTNYRCLPEIVDHANELMTNHKRGVPMEARPDPTKGRGDASIVVQEPPTHAAGAVTVISQIKQDLAAGESLSDHAVLTRTNMEQNDFETACIIHGIPYARKGGTSFLKSPETITVMCYVNLAVGQDFGRMQSSLIEVLNKPNRFFLRSGEAERIVKEVVEKRARILRVSIDNVNPIDLFDREGINLFLDTMDPAHRWESWKARATAEELENLGRSLRGIRESVESGKTYDRIQRKEKKYTTQDLFGDILAIPGVPEQRGAQPPTLRDVLMPMNSSHEEEGDAPDQDDDNKKPVGNVEFLFQIAQPDLENPETDPSDPKKFKARIDKLAAGARDLRVDLDQWDAEQQKLAPNERKAPPCVVLSTIHSVKGAQWKNTTVVMAKGVFPFEPKPNPDEENLPPDVQAELAKERDEEFRTERQLAYVAMTRAAKSLTIVCPAKSVYGRDAGPSVFVSEAGLVKGQNVLGKNDPTPETAGTDVAKVLSSYFASAAVLEDPREGEDGDVAMGGTYDRRPL